jgi:PAS domain S-box-containing protein
VSTAIETALRMSVDNLLEGVQVIGFDWTYLYVNRAASEHGGRSASELLGRTMMACYPGIDRTEMFAALQRVMRSRRSERMVNEVTCPSGDHRWFELLMEPVPDGVCVLSVDVTERQRLQAELRQSHKMEAVGRLAGGIAHDFNNVLTAILGYCELVLDRVGGDPSVAADIEEIRSAGERATSLTRQLLAYSRKQVLIAQVIDLNQVVLDLDKLLRRVIREDIRLEIAPATGLHRTKADPGQIEQVLTNLVINARDAMPLGGTIRISTTNADVDAQFARRHQGLRAGRYVTLTVEDDGDGMAPEVLAHIFEPFFTTKAPGQGTGLGMATVYGIVKQSGGYVAIASTIGRGTTVTIFLPAVEAPLDAPNERPAIRAAAGRGSETLLLVEDDSTLRDLMRRTLLQYGYSILDARDVEHARTLGHTHCGKIQLLVTDIVMPGMNGPNLAQLILTENPTMKVLYVSGFTHSLAAASVASRVTLLPKPFPPSVLAATVRECLDR